MSDPVTPAPPVETASVFEDFIDIFFAPARVFARRAAGRFGLALCLVTLLAVGANGAARGPLRPLTDATMQGALAQRPNMTDAQRERAAAVATRVASVVDRFWFVLILVGIPLTALMFGLFIWVGGKVLGGSNTVAASIMIATYAMIPRVLDTFVRGLQAAFLVPPEALTTPRVVSLSVARFLDPASVSPFLLRVAGQLDVFALWTAVLIGIGLHVAGKLPAPRAAIAATLLWMVGLLAPVAPADRPPAGAASLPAPAREAATSYGFASNRRDTSAQFTTFHHAAM